jgi:hypothetical protein
MVQGFETATNSFTDALASKMRGFGNAVQRLSGFANPPVPGSFGGFNAQVGPGQSPVFNRPVTDFGQGDEPSFSQSEAGQLLRLLFVPTSETPSIPSGVSADEVSDFTRKMYPQDDSGQLLLTSGQAQLLTAQNVPGPKGVFNKLAAISQHFDPSQFGIGMLRANAAAGVTKRIQKIVDEGDIPLFHGTPGENVKGIISGGSITPRKVTGISLTRSSGMARDVGGPIIFVLKRRELKRLRGGLKPTREKGFGESFGGGKEAEERLMDSIPTSMIKEVLVDPTPFTRPEQIDLIRTFLRANIPLSFIKGSPGKKELRRLFETNPGRQKEAFSAQRPRRFGDLSEETLISITDEAL